MVFGVPGTDGQHSFFQKIHQGTDVIPIEFIGVKNPQINQDSKFKGSTSQEKLKANLAGQLKALATGKEHKDANEAFSGNRETSLLLVDQITPKTIGALLAYFENKVMFQGFLWNLNSFDQPGVQLGKLLTDEVLKPEGPKDPVLKSIKALIG
jgi:glucose-6-phosphate isomerase